MSNLDFALYLAEGALFYWAAHGPVPPKLARRPAPKPEQVPWTKVS